VSAKRAIQARKDLYNPLAREKISEESPERTMSVKPNGKSRLGQIPRPMDERNPQYRSFGYRTPAAIIAAATILMVAADLRIWGAQNGLWLDEILSLELAARVSSVTDIFFKIHFDNNHYLNTLFLYLLGNRGDWPGYRMLSVVAGIGTVALAGVIGKEKGRAGALIAMILTGFSYVLTLYSSEARGYSTLVFFSLLSYHLMRRYLRDPRWPLALAFSLSATLGFLSHLTFLSFFLSLLLWSACVMVRKPGGLKRLTAFLALSFGLPSAVLIVLYLGDIRYMQIGGGTPQGLWHCYESAEAWVLGMPPMTAAGFAVMIIFFGLAIQMLWRQERELILLFASGIAGMPLLLAWLDRSDFFYVRYFIIQIALSLIVLAYYLAFLWRRPGYAGKVVTSLILTLYLAANGRHLIALYQFGRGDDRDALRYMAERSGGSAITVGGDIDLRIGTVLLFYSSLGIEQRPIRYFTHSAWPAQGPEWFVAEKESFDDPVSPANLEVAGHQYKLVRLFPSAPLSGLHWFVYHREDG
jgi:hypothetical protein